MKRKRRYLRKAGERNRITGIGKEMEPGLQRF